MGNGPMVSGDYLSQLKKAYDESPEGQQQAWKDAAEKLVKNEADRQASEFPIVHGSRVPGPSPSETEEISE